MDSSILTVIKKEILIFLRNKGVKNLETIEKNSEAFQFLYVENLYEKTGSARMSCRGKKKEIVVDKQFVLFDRDGNPIGWDKNLEQLIHSQLGHEILHAMSINDKGIGIKIAGENDKFSRQTGLNEGLTQLITEDIYGYIVSPNADNYTDYKKIAKILQFTFGENVVLNAYFNQSNSLEKACNNMAQSSKFYESFNRALTQMYFLHMREDTNSVNLYNTMVQLSFQNICANIMLPYLQTLSKAEQSKYLTAVLESVKDQPLIGQQIADTLKNFAGMETSRFVTEKEKIGERLHQMGTDAENRVNRPLEKNNDEKQKISFQEVKECLAQYTIDYEQDPNNQWAIYVKDRVTGEKVKDVRIQKIAKFAAAWHEAAGVKYIEGEKVASETYAFNDASERIFNQLGSLIISGMQETGKIDSKTIMETFSQDKYKYSDEIINSLFANQVKIRWLYDFYAMQTPHRKLETELPKTSTEILAERGGMPFGFDYNSGYIKMRVEEIIDIIGNREKDVANMEIEDSGKVISTKQETLESDKDADKSEELWEQRLKHVKMVLNVYDITEENYQYEELKTVFQKRCDEIGIVPDFEFDYYLQR